MIKLQAVSNRSMPSTCLGLTLVLTHPMLSQCVSLTGATVHMTELAHTTPDNTTHTHNHI